MDNFPQFYYEYEQSVRTMTDLLDLIERYFDITIEYRDEIIRATQHLKELPYSIFDHIRAVEDTSSKELLRIMNTIVDVYVGRDQRLAYKIKLYKEDLQGRVSLAQMMQSRKENPLMEYNLTKQIGSYYSNSYAVAFERTMLGLQQPIKLVLEWVADGLSIKSIDMTTEELLQDPENLASGESLSILIDYYDLLLEYPYKQITFCDTLVLVNHIPDIDKLFRCDRVLFSKTRDRISETLLKTITRKINDLNLVSDNGTYIILQDDYTGETFVYPFPEDIRGLLPEMERIEDDENDYDYN